MIHGFHNVEDVQVTLLELSLQFLIELLHLSLKNFVQVQLE
jgi:hypothetical protein